MRILRWIVYVVIGAILLAFAFANREPMTVYFDPLGGASLPPREGPAWLVLMFVAAVGVVAGSFMTWIGQSKHRRAAHQARAEADRLRRELQAARTSPAPSPSYALARQA